MKIALSVIFAHICVIGALLYVHTPPIKAMTRRPVVVKTYTSSAPKYLKLDKPISLLVASSEPLVPEPMEIKQPELELDPEPEPQVKQQEPEVKSEPEKKGKAAESESPPLIKKTPIETTKKVESPSPPKVKKTIEKKKPEEPKPSKVKAATKTPEKSTAAKHPSKNSQKPTIKKESTSKANPSQEKLIAMMQQSLKTLSGTCAAQASTPIAASSKTIGKLASETLTFGIDYEEELASYLETHLTLPEKGNVRLRLTLKREGSVQKIEILTASSDRNRHYVETALAGRSFPAFGSQFKGENSHTFTLTLISK